MFVSSIWLTMPPCAVHTHMQSDVVTGRYNIELEFHKYEVVHVKWKYDDCDDDSLKDLQLSDIVLPESFEQLRTIPDFHYGFGGQPTERSVRAVTSSILYLYCAYRMKAFSADGRTKYPLLTNNLARIRGTPTEVIGSYNTPSARKLRVSTLHPPRKEPLFKVGDHYALRTREECRMELARMGKIIDQLIAPTLETFNEDVKGEMSEPSSSRSDKCTVKVKLDHDCSCKRPKLKRLRAGCEFEKPFIRRKDFKSDEDFLTCLKSLESQNFKYLQGYLPVDPEIQKDIMLKNYAKILKEAEEKFTLKIEKRYKSLIRHLDILSLETYPSKLIKKVIPKITPKLSFFQDAYKFILKEEKLWPNIFPEVILMDYLFSHERHIPTDVAVLIISCLIDLQEDFRYNVKRAFLRYLLQSPFERRRFQLELEPPEFPVMTIKAPVPWKAYVQLARNHLDQVLMTTHPVIRALNILWHQLYNDLVVVNAATLLLSEESFNADQIYKFVQESCDTIKDLLINDWLPRCADMMDVMRKTWKDLIPMTGAYGGRAGVLFRCVHALMSHHLESLITRSLEYLYRTLCAYTDGNTIEKYNVFDPKLKRRPLMTLIVSVVGAHFDNPTNADWSREHKIPGIYREDEDDASPFYKRSNPDTLAYLHCIHEDHPDMLVLYENVRDVINKNWSGPVTYLFPVYKYYYALLSNRLMPIVEKIYTQHILPDLPAVVNLMRKLKDIIKESYTLRDFVPLNLFKLDNRHLKGAIVMLTDRIYDFIIDFYNAANINENRAICDILESMSMKAGERPEETAEVVALQNYLLECRDERIFAIKNDIKTVAKRVLFLLTHTIHTEAEIHLNSRTFILPGELEEVLDLSAIRLNVIRDNLEAGLREKRTTFEKLILFEKRRMDGFRVKETREMLTLDELKERVETVDALFDMIEKLSREAKAINVEEHLLQLDVSPFAALAEILEKMEPIEKLWNTAYEFEKDHHIWMYQPYSCLNADVISEEVENMYRIMYKLSRQLATNPMAKRACEQMRAKIEKFRVFIPVLDSVCRHGLEDRHWQKISDHLGKECNPKLYPSLRDILEAGIMNILPQLEEISVAAGKEYDLKTVLDNMKNDWKDVQFDVLQYRDSDTHILASIDDIQTQLDDHIMRTQAMKRSPFIVALGSKADDWENRLTQVQNIIDTWTQVQVTWMYLEPIFSSEDIMRQMPLEGRNFKAVDKVWRRIMRHTNHDLHVMVATEYPNMLDIFLKAVDDLETVQKGLNTYLEQKRLFFARFFFLSNDELLEILSETKDPLRVQPHLKKCFEGICMLTFDDNMEIVEMISDEDEHVALVRKVNPQSANGLVEIWLKDVESTMLQSVKEQMRFAWEDYFQVERINWVVSWPGQVVQGISCMAWTYEVEEAIEADELSIYLEKSNAQISDLVKLVRTDLATGTRITIEALIVLDVHARDVVKYLLDMDVSSLLDFDWISQLRYYWKSIDKKEDWVFVSMVVTDVKYGMEYLGNTTRLVVTPLTDRCYRTLMGALKLCLGGAPEGPAGTGKTETCKDLAKSVAKKCVGLAQSGAWACFDEFNRIELEVLSVVAQQILTIQRAIGRKVVRFFFEDTMLRLDPTCSVFITMNPGSNPDHISNPTAHQHQTNCGVIGSRQRTSNYAGRTELPDNLKVLFRTVAMMVPDYAMIGEITLYSNGFDEARHLAQKIVQAYKLCSEQLSSQSHYDYGMRAVKSVLLASASLRRLYSHLPEAQIVLRAIVDVNLPKFLEQDVSLFIGIYTDLFPGTELPMPSREDLLKWLLMTLEERNLQATPWFVEKILQIYEMLLVRHGLMVVGASLGGKTTAWQVLAYCLRCVNMDKNATLSEYPVNYRIINPKAITMGQLYGRFDPISHEWYDGVLAKTFREFATGSPKERFWIFFDGPVDAVWIENLNTVLDDNKKLCLMSGEIIIMSKLMNMMFEPADLEQASPATVSRCGMIYMEPSQLGWKAFHQSFVNVLTDQIGLSEIYMALFQEMIDWLIPAALSILPECKKMVETSPIYQYKMFSKFFYHFLDKHKVFTQVWFQQMFLFCYAWAYCSHLMVKGIKRFDALIRKILYGGNEDFPRPKYFTLNRGQMFPEKLTFMDYRFDEAENWWTWQKSGDDPTATITTFPDDAQLSELIVPTNESGYITYWEEFCINKSYPMLVIGPTGTGKSAIVGSNLLSLSKQSYLINIVNFSARTSAQLVQDTIMSKLDRRRKGVFGPPLGKKCITFCDDVAMPSKDTYGSQPPLELLRQWLDHGYWSDLIDTTKIELVDMSFMGAMGIPGGSNFIFPRLYHHTFVVAVDSFEDSTIIKIFTTIGDWHFAKGYAEKVALLSRGLAEAMVSVYRSSMSVFLPTPAKSHYTFSLRDITRVFQGIVMVPPKRLNDPEKLGLICLENFVFGILFSARLIDERDRDQLLEMVTYACKTSLRFSLEQAFQERMENPGGKVTAMDLRNLFFGNYIDPDAEPKIYDEVMSYNKLEKLMHYYLKDYNAFSNSPMDLVLFRFAIEHISRVSRVLQMPRGNVLMVGMGGSGRRSSCRLAAHIADCRLWTVQVTKTYTTQDWRDDLKKILLSAGFNLNHTVFLFSDSQATDEAYVEDINGILNCGDLPNLYQLEDKAAIMENMTSVARQLGKVVDPLPSEMYAFFIDRVREQLHVALAFSPIGESFKERIRMYPSLINCCTIDCSMNLHQPEEIEEQVVTETKSRESAESEKSLEEVQEIVLSDLENELVQVVMYFNRSVVAASEKCYTELSRRNYVTPSSYLEMLKAFRSFYKRKLEEITRLRDRYTTGLEKLDFAAAQVGEMQSNLYELQPKLKVLSEETERIMVNIERETAEAEKKKEIVGADEAAANEAAAAAQAIKDDCESDLAEAIPALEAALDALNTLKPADIIIVKSMKSPPYSVKLTLEAVCVLKGIKPDRKPDASGRMVEDYWAVSLRMVSDMKFLESLKTFDKDNIPPLIMKKIRERYVADRDFVPEKIKSASTACEGLCRWVLAMDVYDKVARIVMPKKAALAEAENDLASQMEKLNAKRAELQIILDKLQKLNDFFAEKSRQKKGLEDEIENCEKKLNRAEKLLGGLGGEKTRWGEAAQSLHKSISNIVGDVLLAGGCTAYLGFFPTEYRVYILEDWNELCVKRKIPCSEKFSLASTLGNPMQIRAWSLAGLPSDNFSVENAIIVSNSNRYSLLIDPQVQANKWIKNMEKKNSLKVIKQTDANYMQVLELCITYGTPVLIENVGGYVIKCGDQMIEYNSNFRLYITTCLRNPHYSPEIMVMSYITRNMDRSFVEPPPFDLNASFGDSSPKIPLVFLLSPGSDPMASLFMYAKQRNMYDKTKTISLGQGQGPRAEKMILEANRYGQWVVLQNCHVAVSWMGELERICSDTSLAEMAHADYRLWCTSYPSSVFPVSVLQNSVKMTNEPPKGLKANMQRSFNSDPLVRDKFFTNAFIFMESANKCWLRGVFALVFFHAVVQERREFGPLGWNIPYEFSEADLKTKTISLGQGQGPRAEKMILEANRYGQWVVLQNCHVAVSWMGELERICSDTSLAEMAHADYRLWCTSYPSSVFPVSVLQNSVKMTNEPPKGLKANMQRSFNSDPLVRDKFFTNAFIFMESANKCWLRGVFALVFFHAVVQERREFGPLGWNIPYEFSEADLKISLLQLKMFISQSHTIPFRGHVYLTGECNYGGRVTDDKDRRLILSLLNMLYNPNTIEVENYALSQSGEYRVPQNPTRTNALEYIAEFPLSPHPEVYGLHENADINRNNKETNSLIQGVLKTQTELMASAKASGAAEGVKVDPVFQICKDILARMPEAFDLAEVSQKYPVIYTNSMNTVLRQELIRFNRLLDYIRKSLVNVMKAIQGQIAMIPELERTHKSMVVGKLPADWLKKSYPSLKPLGSYVNDFLARLEFFQNWINNGEPNVYWMSGFYFTQSFMTGVLQNYSRRNRFQIDMIKIDFEITKFEVETDHPAKLGAYIRGLFLEGCRWNRSVQCIDESYQKILFDTIPVTLLIPALITLDGPKVLTTKDGRNIYECPVYKTSERRGILSTTGHSTNFVMYMDIPCTKTQMHWINRGAASLCQLDD
uniref:Dynein heavy chain 3, axonemal n=1 Tax=Glossina palpalis gambiensis TaxID=67801 RepID=A0A1B0B0B8_9MUSC